MHHREGHEFLDRMKLAMLDAEVVHHAQRGDLDKPRIDEHLATHGIDVTEDELNASVERLVDEGILEKVDGHFTTTDDGYEAWLAAVNIAVHTSDELRDGVQATKAADHLGGAPAPGR